MSALLEMMRIPEMWFVAGVSIATVLLATTLATDLGLPAPAFTGFIVSWILALAGFIVTTGLGRPMETTALMIGLLAGGAVAFYLGTISLTFFILRRSRARYRYGASVLIGLTMFLPSIMGMARSACALDLCGDDAVVSLPIR
ncbi:MAG: hypothetical protein ACO1Q7_06230 [Gemmatimonas sp.]